MRQIQNPAIAIQPEEKKRAQPLLMHPIVFIGAWILLGSLFALQEWMNLRRWGYHIGLDIELESWGAEFLIWGTLSWLLWRTLGLLIRNAGPGVVLSRILPLSAAVCLVKEIIWVLLFPSLPLNRPYMPYWARLQFHLKAEIVNDMVIFWCSILLIRGLGYYQRSRNSERVAAQLEVQLANARISTLRMQLNPHFLFNAMNSISSLMRIDVDAADEMLEQLSSLLRITLERESVQMISLRDEVEFLEVYLSMQDRRYSDRVRRRMSIDPALHDALVPAMILQPVVENAYVHGLSKIDKSGDLVIDARRLGNRVAITVTNSGLGLSTGSAMPSGCGVGISNLRSRLELHYKQDCFFEMLELDRSCVRVRIEIPFQLPDAHDPQFTRFGVE